MTFWHGWGRSLATNVRSAVRLPLNALHALVCCAPTANRCEKQDGCPFALCHACDRRYARNAFQVNIGGPLKMPSLIKTSCSMCPPAIRGCYVHLNIGIAMCTSCDDIRCSEHRCIAPGIGLCSCDRFPLCTRPDCRPAGHYYQLCGDCYLQTCDRCEEKAGGRCQDCGGELLWKDTDEEWE